MTGARTKAFLCEMAADSSSKVSQAATPKPYVGLVWGSGDMGRTEAFLCEMAADSSSTVSQAAAHSPALASSHCFLASAMAFSRFEIVSCASACGDSSSGRG